MSGRRAYLGEFEQIVLLAVARLGARAYGMELCREIADCTGRRVSIGAMYATLDRLTSKNYLRARDETADGRPRRVFTLTRAGIDALHAANELHARMWAGVRLPKARSRG
jgi:DNA-binding PadR family transcriptional regulator